MTAKRNTSKWALKTPSTTNLRGKKISKKKKGSMTFISWINSNRTQICKHKRKTKKRMKRNNLYLQSKTKWTIYCKQKSKLKVTFSKNHVSKKKKIWEFSTNVTTKITSINYRNSTRPGSSPLRCFKILLKKGKNSMNRIRRKMRTIRKQRTCLSTISIRKTMTLTREEKKTRNK